MSAYPPQWDREQKAAEKMAIGLLVVGLLLFLVPGAYLAHTLGVFR